MQECEEVQCPYCGQGMELVIDTTIAQQRFTTDCEVCCRPFEVFAECETGEILSLEVQAQPDLAVKAPVEASHRRGHGPPDF